MTTTHPAATTHPAGPATRRRSRRHRPLRWIAVAGGTVALLLTAVCGSDSSTQVSADASAHHHDAARAVDGNDPGVVDVTMADHSFAASKAQVDAGAVTFRVSNQGTEPHQMQIGRMKPGTDADTFLTTFQDQGEYAAISSLEWVGGANTIDPGATGEAVSELTPGEYLMICFSRGADGVPHLMKQMVAPITVVDGDGDGDHATPPTADATITVRDYAIEVPTRFDGQGVVAIDNQGGEPHEVTLMRLAEGTSVADVFGWFASPAGPPPFTDQGGLGVVAPGQPAWSTMHLEPGNYLAVCFVPAADGTPHALKGMTATFTVG